MVIIYTSIPTGNQGNYNNQGYGNQSYGNQGYPGNQGNQGNSGNQTRCRNCGSNIPPGNPSAKSRYCKCGAKTII